MTWRTIAAYHRAPPWAVGTSWSLRLSAIERETHLEPAGARYAAPPCVGRLAADRAWPRSRASRSLDHRVLDHRACSHRRFQWRAPGQEQHRGL